MSAGAVPICTPVGGLRDIIKPDIGFLSKDLSTESYLAALKAFLNSDSTTIEKLKANCRAVYQNEFSMKIVQQNIINFIIIMWCSIFLNQTMVML